jgi:hypothetical protein
MSKSVDRIFGQGGGGGNKNLGEAMFRFFL